MSKLLQDVGFGSPTVIENKWQPLGHPFRDDLRIPLTTKLYGSLQELEKTALFVTRSGLVVQPANAKKQKKIVSKFMSESIGEIHFKFCVQCVEKTQFHGVTIFDCAVEQ